MIDYEESARIIFALNGSVLPQAFFRALPAPFFALLILICEDYIEDFRERTGLLEISQSFMWNAASAVIVILLGFRTRTAFGRFWEGTGLLHQMQAEWFDAASCLVAFSRDAKVAKFKLDDVMEFRHTLVRLMSLMHASALDEISAVPDESRYEVLNIRGLDRQTLKFLRECRICGFNRVEALQHMLQVLVTHNHHSGVLTIPPPILSRVYQTLSRGLVNLLNARKIKDTMFPFPYAQMIWVLIFLHTVFTPVLISQHVTNKVCCVILSFLPIFGMQSLNFAAGELEMPFGTDDNDLPLRHFQTEMNQALLMLLHDMTDHLPHTHGEAVKDFEKMKCFLEEERLQQAGFKVTSHCSSFLEEDFFSEQEKVEGPIPYKNSTTKVTDALYPPPKKEEPPAPAPAPAPAAPPPAMPAPAPAAAPAPKENAVVVLPEPPKSDGPVSPPPPPNEKPLGVFFRPRDAPKGVEGLFTDMIIELRKNTDTMSALSSSLVGIVGPSSFMGGKMIEMHPHGGYNGSHNGNLASNGQLMDSHALPMPAPL
eukprot:TRINITY_DN2491_c3_g1_i1.p1 TRINITY_DN2491_c3_g1~~TRINITY_DN2491_c3_g1_i1.p1  ORF type:complete len:539 (+),score=132.24 TRINITY_DN2491_c3_g1_i1:154-1770(+)